MANILNIDTSSSICSVALAKDGEVKVGFESSKIMDHSSSLAPFVRHCVDSLAKNNETPDAISVTIGPGSYTGLRIGLSLAKGLSYGYNIPLITLSTLEVMAVRAIFTYPDFSGNELIIPMIDAKRMEVYTGAYNSSLELEMPESALILDENTFENFHLKSSILFIGDGSEKFKNLYKGTNAQWLGSDMSHAKYMTALSEKYFRNNNFADVAYTTPMYLKEYQVTQPKNKLNRND